MKKLMKGCLWMAGVAVMGLVVLCIGFVLLGKHLETREAQACAANLLQIERAIQAWAQDNQKGADQPVTYRDIKRYIQIDGELTCPSAPPEEQPFEKCYQLTTVGTAPVCLHRPKEHVLPRMP